MSMQDLDLGRYALGWRDPENYVFKSKKGLSVDVVEEMSWMKGEPDWMRQFRLKSLRHFDRRPMPTWGGDLSGIDFNDIYYYVKPTDRQVDTWDALPQSVKDTYEKLGIPEAERKYLAGVTAQFECLRGSSRVYTSKGVRPIKELEVGDEVFSLDQDREQIVPARVTALACSGEKEVFEIKGGGATIGASANHPFLVSRGRLKSDRLGERDKTEWLPVEELRVGDYVAVAADLPEFGESAALLLPEGQAQSLPSITSDDLMWFLGVYLSDGYLDQSQQSVVQIAIGEIDSALVSEIQRVASEQFDLDLQLSSDGGLLTAGGTVALAEFLVLNGLSGTALTKRVPDWVSGLPRSQRLAFLAGYVDANATVRSHAANKDVVLTSANADLSDDVKELASLCGIWLSSVTMHESKHSLDSDSTSTGLRWLLSFSGGFDRLPLRSDRMSGLRVHVQAARTIAINDTAIRSHGSDMLGYVRIESIESAGVETTWDIEVEGHHNFVAEGFIVHNSEVVYHRNNEVLEQQGVIFCDMDTALREHPEIVKKYFGTVIPANDNKFSALNSAVWSGGSFIYVPPGVRVEMPLQAYFRINAENMGQFERTLIIADEGSQVHYIEGCSAPEYSSESLHSAVVEIVVKPSARVTYTTIQNWYPNVFNLVTKRARVDTEGHMEWIDGNIGSRLTMKYPAVYLMGPKASGEVLSVAYAGPGQHQDAGAKMVHAAPETTSTIVSKSISKDGGRTSYRGLVRVEEGAHNAKSFVRCDALLLDEISRSDTYPYMEVGEQDAQIGHEATVSKVGDDQLFYLMSRGLSESQAMSMIVNGFIEPVTRTLPMEYAVEWSRLIELQMEGSIG